MLEETSLSTLQQGSKVENLPAGNFQIFGLGASLGIFVISSPSTIFVGASSIGFSGGFVSVFGFVLNIFACKSDLNNTSNIAVPPKYTKSACPVLM